MIILFCKTCMDANLSLGEYNQFFCPTCNKDLQMYEVEFANLKEFSFTHNNSALNVGPVVLEEKSDVISSFGFLSD